MLLVLAAAGSPAAASPPSVPPNPVGAAASGLRFTREERAADAILAAQRRDFLERHAASLKRLFTAPIAALRRELAHEELYQTLHDMPKGGLRTLKQMALDSILRNSLPADRRERRLDLFQRRWRRFIRGVIEEDREAAAGTERVQALPDAA